MEGLERWKAVRSALERTGESGTAEYLALGVLLLAIGLLVIFIVSRVQRRVSLKRKWNRLDDIIEQLALKEEAARVLRQLAELYDVTDPVRVTRERKAFEEAVHTYIEGMASLFPRPVPECTTVADLRHELGFLTTDVPVLHSTRQLTPGDTLQMSRVGEGAESEQFGATVRRVREDFIDVRLDGGGGSLTADDSLLVVALTPEGRYSFSTSVVRVQQEPDGTPCPVLNHTLDIQKRERRESRRVEIEGPFWVRLGGDDEQDWEKMRLSDLSTGGARIRGARVKKASDGEKSGTVKELEARFCPADLIGDDIDDPNLQEDFETTARVVESRQIGSDMWEYRLDFGELTHDEHRFLARVVYLVETRSQNR